MEFLSCYKVAIELSTGLVVIYKQHLLMSQVMYANGSIYAVCERGGTSNFEIIGEF